MNLWKTQAEEESSENDHQQACAAPADEIDAIASKRENAQREMERRIVAQMLTCMDDLSQTPASRGQDAAEDAGADQEETKPQRSPPARHVVIIGMNLGVTLSRAKA